MAATRASTRSARPTRWTRCQRRSKRTSSSVTIATGSRFGPRGANPLGRASALADHVARGLVVAQPLEAGMAQAAVAGPLGEADLCDELGPDPGHVALADRVRVGERRTVRAQGLEPVADGVERGVAEARADLARVAQPIPVVDAEQERAEARPRSARRRVAAHDELLPVLALELEPVVGASRGIRAVG